MIVSAMKQFGLLRLFVIRASEFFCLVDGFGLNTPAMQVHEAVFFFFFLFRH